MVHAKPDARCQEALENAVAIFGTNDIKYHVNKRRAMLWATSRAKTVYVAVARDKASATVLQEKPDLMAEKLQWLQRQDKECGGVVWVVAALRRHAGSRHGTLRQKTGHPKRMPRDDRRLVALCRGNAGRRCALEYVTAGCVCEV